MLYHWYELGHAAVRPARYAADTYHRILTHPYNPLAHLQVGQQAAAACEIFERSTRRYEKPSFGISETFVSGETISVTEQIVWKKPFCQLLHFKRDRDDAATANDPNVLLVAPMSGHYATLLRGTVETLLPNHNVFITDWTDASTVPISEGRFDLDDYIDYVIEMLSHLKGDVHVIGVCQPSVPVLAAISLMEAERHPHVPWSMTLIGGPIDTRINQTAVNKVAEGRDVSWFRDNVTTHVPWSLPGAGRSVYPGFLQLSGFMSMNLDRHAKAHYDFFRHLVEGDGDSAEKHRIFYDEYLAVMDLSGEFYLQTIDTVFIKHALAKGEMRHRGKLIDPGAVTRVGLMTIEGEKDDITGIGQCSAAHTLCNNLPNSTQQKFEAAGVGHYGLFNGSRFRKEIAPRIAQFIRTHDPRWDTNRSALLQKFQNKSIRGRESQKTIAEPAHPANGAQTAHLSEDTSMSKSKTPCAAPNSGKCQQNRATKSPLNLWHLSHSNWIFGLKKLIRSKHRRHKD